MGLIVKKIMFFKAVFVIGCLTILNSCASSNKIAYFSNQQDAAIPSSNQPSKSVINTNDLLSVAVSSLSTQTSTVFNSPNYAGATSAVNTGGVSSQTNGYLVNTEGLIKFPLLGKVKAEGLTTSQLEDTITKLILDKKFLLDPIVSVRQLNFKVTVLGEVTHPLVINVSNEKISILEALGLAGDLTIYGKRGNVLLIREEKGEKIMKRLDLNSDKLLSSPYYYLKSNDVIYVEPDKANAASKSRNQQLFPILFAALSFAIVIIDHIK